MRGKAKAKRPKKRLLSTPQVRERYAGVSRMTIWRWTQDERLRFPKPIKILDRNYRDERALDAFDERLAEATA